MPAVEFLSECVPSGTGNYNKNRKKLELEFPLGGDWGQAGLVLSSTPYCNEM